MAGLLRNTHDAARTGPAASEPAGPDCRLVDWRASLRRAEHACCCPARPAVVVIMPATAERPYPIDLLLCRHHYQVCARALMAAGATVFDTRGSPVTTGQVRGCREPARRQPHAV